jgi:putative CocE/NonD family hydrolase
VLDGAQDTDESTDAFDTVDWLIKHIANNNGKVGMIGISYNGYYTSCALIRAHPALVAASPQAPMADLYRGDDAYHNGAFFLAANFSFYTEFYPQNNPVAVSNIAPFDYGTKDFYKFYLQMGPLADSDRLYLLNKNPYWTDMYRHTSEDGYWKARGILPHLKAITPAVLIVGGWYDAQDLYGTLMTYQAIRRQSPSTDCKLIMGPWPHGGWNFANGDRLGAIAFGENTADKLRGLQLRFFKEHLKGDISAEIPPALVFETGGNEWKAESQWPPRGVRRKLYLAPHGKLAWKMPLPQLASDSYVSDPANPVPYLPAAPQKMVEEYMIADQRFLAGRKDLLSYESDPLDADVTIAGPVSPDLFVSTSGSDSDFDVKLIDVYPPDGGDLAGYQQLVRGEPFRGKFRKSFATPEPFIPGKIEELRFSMPDAYHCFKKGHRLMIQIQSSWFPLTDRNPQTFIEIPDAKAEDFVPATEHIYRARRFASFVEVTVEANATERPERR